MPSIAALLLSAVLTPTLAAPALGAPPAVDWPEQLGTTTAGSDAASSVAGPVSALPNPNLWDVPADGYSRYEAEVTCDPAAKPGIVGLRDEILQPVFGGSRYDFGTSRACSPASSGHEEGRAMDWMMDSRVPAEAANARRFLDWLLASDGRGNAHAQARRLGIMYVLYNNRTWRAYRPQDGWRPQTYGGRDCATLGASYASNCHRDHVHISVSRAGAQRQTTYWSAPAGVRPNTAGPYPGTQLRIGSRGDAVLRFERRLAALGLLTTRYVNGYFGGATADSTRVFQSRTGLYPDGVVGTQTWQAADSAGGPDRRFAEEAAASPVSAVSP